MKYLFLMMAFTLSSYTLQSQIEKGDILLSGTIGYSSAKNSLDEFDIETSVQSFSFLASGEYLVSSNFGIGVGLGFDRTSSKWEDFFSRGSSKSSSIRFGALGSYWAEISDNAYIRPAAGFVLVSEDIDDFELSGLLIALQVGVPIFVSKNVFISPSITYRFGSLEDQDNDDWDYSDLQLSISIGTSLN